MVSPEEEQGGRVAELQGPQVQHTLGRGSGGQGCGRWAGGETDLYTEVAAVNVVTEEEVLGAGGGASHLGGG